MNAKYLVIVAGPTAIGKTSLAIELAKKYRSEIISADSRQFYKELQIGTAKPSIAERAQVPHHFIDSLSVHDAYNVGTYEQEVLELLDDKFMENDVHFLVGGSGLFVNAICNGLDKFPEIDPAVRGHLNKEFTDGGLAPLAERLKLLDPDYYEKVDLKNPQRIIRALEVCISTGQPYSSFHKQQRTERPFEMIKIGLEMEREMLYDRIDKRMDQMIEGGLFEEAEVWYSNRQLNALQTVGYVEIFDFMDGRYDKDEAIRLLKRNSRRYAKRQLTWFKKDEEMSWFEPTQLNRIKAMIDSRMLEGSESKQ